MAIALKLAQERFGSTLTITGSADFKHLVIEAAAKSGLDVHFTDQAMNQGLAARRAELEIERDGQSITPGVSQPAAQGPAPLTFLHNGQPAILDLDRYRVPAEPETSSTLTAHRDEGLAAQPSSTDPKVIVGELIGHGSAPYKNIPDKEPSYFVTVKTDSGHRTLWGVGLADVMQQTPFNPGDRLRIEDKGSVSVMLQLQQTDGSFIEKPGYRREWAAELETTAKSGPTVEQVSTSSSVLATPSEDHGPEMD